MTPSGPSLTRGGHTAIRSGHTLTRSGIAPKRRRNFDPSRSKCSGSRAAEFRRSRSGSVSAPSAAASALPAPTRRPPARPPPAGARRAAAPRGAGSVGAGSGSSRGPFFTPDRRRLGFVRAVAPRAAAPPPLSVGRLRSTRRIRDIGLAAVAMELDLTPEGLAPEIVAAVERGARSLEPREMALAS